MLPVTSINNLPINNKNIGNKKKNIHQLVAETWVPNPHGYTEILHLDENPRNNHYTNLKWGTHKENMSVKALPDVVSSGENTSATAYVTTSSYASESIYTR